MSKTTLLEVKQKTLEFLNSKDEADVSHITQELIDKDNSSVYEDDGQGPDKQTVNEIHGHNVRLQYVEGTYYWYYERGSSPTGAGCGNDMTRRLSSNLWSGTSIGRCNGSDHKVRFTRI